MPEKYIKAGNLAQIEPTAHCWDCGAEAIEAPAEEVWTIWNDDILYCQKCEEAEGDGSEE